MVNVTFSRNEGSSFKISTCEDYIRPTAYDVRSLHCH